MEYAGLTEWAYNSNPIYMEIILNETGDIWMQYRSLSGRTGYSATVGIENSGGSAGCRYSHDTSSLTDGLAIRFSRGYIVTTPSTQTHTVAPSTTTTYTITVSNLQNITDSIKISGTSSAGWTISVCNATSLLPLSDTDADGFPDTGALVSGGSRNIQVNVTVPASPGPSADVTTVNASSYANPLRYSTSTVTTNVFGAWLTPPHTDAAFDDDLDGDAEHLLINVSVYVRATGYYYLYGYLYTSSESLLEFQWTSFTFGTTGAQTMQLSFTPWIIRNSGINGPYHVDMSLYDSSNNLLSTGTHNTSAYAYTDFMDKPGMISAFSEYGVDTDANGKYDYLQLNVTVSVTHAGQFRLYNYLYDYNGYNIGSTVSTVYLAVGNQVVTFTYDANAIWQYTVVNGAYESDTDLYAIIGASTPYMNSQTIDTRSYQISDFDPPAAHFNTSGHSDCDVDVNNDGDHEWILVNVSVNVAVEGDYTITGDLNDGGWYSMTASNTTHLTVGNHTVQLKYAGWLVYETYDYIDGVDLELTDSDSTILDSYDYTLSRTYYYYNFVYYGATIYDHDDYGLDTDSDGSY